MAIIDEQFSDCPDLVKRKVFLKGGQEAYFIYFEGLVNLLRLQRNFINQLF
jgi:spore germination protein